MRQRRAGGGQRRAEEGKIKAVALGYC